MRNDKKDMEWEILKEAAIAFAEKMLLALKLDELEPGRSEQAEQAEEDGIPAESGDELPTLRSLRGIAPELQGYDMDAAEERDRLKARIARALEILLTIDIREVGWWRTQIKIVKACAALEQAEQVAI